MTYTMFKPALVVSTVLAGGLLGGCVQTSSAPVSGPASVTAGPGNCSTEVAAFRQQLDADVATGNLSRRIYSRAQLDANSAATACRNGREAESIRLISQARIRTGY